MPVVLETVQKKLGELSNVRLEIDYDIKGPGIILASDNGIINATLTEQLNNLDKLFETIDLPISVNSPNDIDFNKQFEKHLIQI